MEIARLTAEETIQRKLSMVVFVVENAPVKLRGELTRWLLEAKPGVFVGNVSAMVREHLWKKVHDNYMISGALLLYNSDTEQGFYIDVCGDPKRSVIDLDGIQLIRIK